MQTKSLYTEVLDDGDILRLVGSVGEVAAKDADEDVEDIEAPVPTPGQVMDSLDLLRMLAETEEDTEGILDALRTNGTSVRPLITKRTEAKINDFFGKKKICSTPGGRSCSGNNSRALFSYARAPVLFSENLRFSNTTPHKLDGCRYSIQSNVPN